MNALITNKGEQERDLIDQKLNALDPRALCLESLKMGCPSPNPNGSGAGKNVKFLFTSAENKRYERRVTAEELVEKNTNSDVKKYLLLLYASAADMFSPFGYSAGTVYDED